MGKSAEASRPWLPMGEIISARFPQGLKLLSVIFVAQDSPCPLCTRMVSFAEGHFFLTPFTGWRGNSYSKVFLPYD
jgi:hypothetical protein